MDGRGQTTQDFAVGASVLLVTVIGVYVFIQGGALSVFGVGPPSVEQPQADRVAAYLVENYSTESAQNVVDYQLLAQTLTNDDELQNLTGAAGVNVSSDRRTNPTLNVSIVNSTTLGAGDRSPAQDGGTLLAWGANSSRQDTVTATRVIRLASDPDGDRDQCTPVCWLVVRAW